MKSDLEVKNDNTTKKKIDIPGRGSGLWFRGLIYAPKYEYSMALGPFRHWEASGKHFARRIP